MKLGFIGCGNMATAIIRGVLSQGKITADEIIASAKTEATRSRAASELKIHTTAENREAASADLVFLAIKPQFFGEVLPQIADVFREDQIIVSMAPGKTLAYYKEVFGAKNENPLKLVRIMPNTPALVSAGICGACCNELVTEEDLKKVNEVLTSIGLVEYVPERLMDVVVSVSGSSPAYVYMMIEAMADAAVADGMPRAQAYRFAAQAVMGSAKMVLETGKHPGELKDMVCSPGGTTIEAVRVLEREGFRSALIEAMKACCEKGRNL